MKTGFIDWTGSGLDLYIFEKKGSGYTLTEKESIPLDGEPDPSNLAPLVKAGIQNIHLSIPLDLLTLREQDFPFDDSDKISDTIAFELEGVLLGSTDDYSIDHIVIESGSFGSKVLAVCLEKNRLREIIEVFSAAGLDPKVITSLDIIISEGKIEELLEETKERRITEARYILYYLCHKRGMQIAEIQSYIKLQGFDVALSTIKRGVEKAKDMIDNDTDYKYIVRKLQDIEL